MTDTSNKPLPAKRGFAALTPERRRAIARMGGVAAHVSGHAHEFTSEEAQAASLKRKNRRWPGADLLRTLGPVDTSPSS